MKIAQVLAISKQVKIMAHILVLDDQEDICQLIQRVLVDSGHEVTAFTESREALDWLQSHHPDLALLDLKLRGTDSMGVLKFLHDHRPETKRIIITGQPSREIMIKAAGFGLEDFLLKPLEISVLEERINEALGLS